MTVGEYDTKSSNSSALSANNDTWICTEHNLFFFWRFADRASQYIYLIN